MSDGCDFIVAQTGDKRFKPSMIDPRYLVVDDPVDLQIQDYCDLIAPIADRLLGVCSCNHHETILKRAGVDPGKRICYTLWSGKEAEKRLLSWENFVGIRFHYDTSGAKQPSRVRTLSFYLSHGATTGGRTEGGAMTSLGNVALNYGGVDVFAFGHNHQLSVWNRIQLYPSYRDKKVIAKKLLRVNTGTFLKSRSDDHTVSYAESASMKPNAIGYVEIDVMINRNSIDIVPIERTIL